MIYSTDMLSVIVTYNFNSKNKNKNLIKNQI